MLIVAFQSTAMVPSVFYLVQNMSLVEFTCPMCPRGILNHYDPELNTLHFYLHNVIRRSGIPPGARWEHIVQGEKLPLDFAALSQRTLDKAAITVSVGSHEWKSPCVCVPVLIPKTTVA